MLRKRVVVGPLSLAGCFLIFPLGPHYLPDPPSSHICFDLTLLVHWSWVSLASITFLFALVFVRVVRRAITFKLIGAAWAAVLGLWWLVVGGTVLVCDRPEIGTAVLWSLAIALVLATLIIFTFHLRKALRRVIEMNVTAFDFARMEYHATLPLQRPDGRHGLTRSEMIGFGIAGVALAGIAASSYNDFLFVAVAWFLGYVFLGYLCAGNIYLAWLIHDRTPPSGSPMVVHELVH